MSTPRAFPIRRALVHALAFALAGTAAGEATATPIRPARHLTSQASSSQAPAPDGVAFAITNCNDSGSGSLRQAMLDAHNNAVIDFSQLTCSHITLTTGALTDPNVDSLQLHAPIVTVSGARPRPSITIDANGASRVIEHHSGGELELVGLVLRNGVAADGKGGCVYANGRVQTVASTIEACAANAVGSGDAEGGGIWSDDEVDLLASTVSNCHANAPGGGYAYGGGVFTSYGFSARYSHFYLNYASPNGYGGGVASAGPVSVLASTIDDNTANYGGGIEMFGGSVGPGDLRVVNSTIAGNYAVGFAAGIEANGPLDVLSSTIAGNTGHGAAQASGIVIHGTFALNLVSSIVYGNTQAGAMQDIGGSGSVGGSADLVGHSALALPPGTSSANPLLAPLADNGGQTKTMRLLLGSPAIDHGSNPSGVLCDQRWALFAPDGVVYRPFLRTIGAAPDIGAFELDSRDDFFGDGFEPPVPFDCQP